jgi:hypothetical protein
MRDMMLASSAYEEAEGGDAEEWNMIMKRALVWNIWSLVSSDKDCKAFAEDCIPDVASVAAADDNDADDAMR